MLRIKITLENVSNIYKSKAFIKINEDWKLVQDVENHIIKIFNLKTKIYLTICDDGQEIILPSLESIDIFSANDVLRCWPKEQNGISINEDQKNAGNGESSKIVKSCKNILSMGKNGTNGVPKELTRNAKKSPFTPNNTEEESEEDEGTPQSKIVKSETVNEEAVYEKPKRKRHRKRKNKSPVVAVEETYKPKITKNEELSFQKEKPKVHLKFEENETIDEVLQQSTRIIEALSEIKEIEDVKLPEEKSKEIKEIDNKKTQEISSEPPRVVLAINDDVQEEEKKNKENIPVIEANTKETALETLRNNLKNLDIPLLKELPKVGDIIAFKILAMSDNYLPEISDDMIGVIESINMESQDLKIVIMAKNKIEKSSGKFDLPEDDDGMEDEGVMFINWINLIEPKKIDFN